MESPDLQHIDDFFRDTLRQKDRAPSFAVWDRVEAGLDTRRRRTLLFWWLTGAGSAVILLIGGILTQSLRRETQRLQPENRAISSATRVSLPGTCLSSDPAIASNPAPAGAHAAPRTATPDASASPAGSSACAVHASSTSADLIIGRPPASVPAAHLPLSVPYARFSIPIVRKLRPNGLPARASRKRLEVTAYVSQELAGYSLADHDSAGPHGREIERRQRSSFSTTAGFNASVWLSRHWVFQSGLAYSRSISEGYPATAVAVKDNSGNVSYQINTPTGYGYLTPDRGANIGDSAVTGKITSTLKYLTLPVALSRAWVIRRFTFLAGAGLSANLLVKATVRSSLPGAAGQGEKEVSQYGLRKVNIGLLLKGECRYPISEAWAASVMATFKNSVGPVNIHTSYSTYPYNLGVAVGVTHNF